MATQVELAHEDSVAAFYKIQNCDENGEYRANKYNRTLGTAFLPPAAHVPALPATAPLDDLVAAVAAHGAVVLKGAIPVGDVAAFRAAHDAALAELKPLKDELYGGGRERRGEASESFYRASSARREGLWGEELDLRLPDYYFNALVPLGAASPEAGTEILLGSTRSAGTASRPRWPSRPPAGDVVFFNGASTRPNAAEARRDLVSAVYAAKWFEQGRDPAAELPASADRAPRGAPFP
ncbi:hypothetical protein JL721_2385 [Aureococcus anophagefferens]|nr:hypothetical protein JL721_2385 [Aureococcus anophagefferens]